MRFVRNILFLSSLLTSSSAKQAATQEDELNHSSPRQLLANTKASKGLKHGLTFPTMKDRPLAKEMFSSRKKQKKRSILPSSSFLVRHLIKNGNGQMNKFLPSIAKSFLGRKARESAGGMFSIMAEPDWANKYQETIDAIIDLFIDMLAETDFDLGDLFSPSDYCNYSDTVAAEPAVCEETVSAFLTLISNFAYHPWVSQDILFFIVGNISMLPLDHIFDWENLREFLHSIPKEFIYDDVILPFISMVWEGFSWVIIDELPVLIETFYMTFEPSGLLDDGSADFASLLSYFIGEDISKEMVDYIHAEICYAATLEQVWMDFDAGYKTIEWDEEFKVTNVPFCVYPEFREEMAQEELFRFEGGYDDVQCEISGHFSETVDDEVVIENPDDKFMMFEENGEATKRKCKWLRDHDFNFRMNACSVPPQIDDRVAIKVCPSSCCVHEEESSSDFLKKVDVVGDVEIPITQTCKWLSKKPENVIKKVCKKKKSYDSPDVTVRPAYVMCPETCGICDSSDSSED